MARISIKISLLEVSQALKVEVKLQLEDLQAFTAGFNVRRPSSCDGTPPNSAVAQPSIMSMDIQDFKLLKPISRGSFGRVYLCEKKATKDLFAIKVDIQV